jgi:hypothetical protein
LGTRQREAQSNWHADETNYRTTPMGQRKTFAHTTDQVRLSKSD